jgi:hypothetical protein
MDEEQVQREVPLAWVGVEEVPLLYADQFVTQSHQDMFILSIGQVVPPAFIGKPEERAKQLEQIAYIPVKAVSRVTFSSANLDQLIEALQQMRDLYGQQQNQTKEGDEG